jgi:hypothetical protein
MWDDNDPTLSIPQVPKLFCPVDHLPIFSVFRRPLPRGRSKTSQAV